MPASRDADVEREQRDRDRENRIREKHQPFSPELRRDGTAHHRAFPVAARRSARACWSLSKTVRTSRMDWKAGGIA